MKQLARKKISKKTLILSTLSIGVVILLISSYMITNGFPDTNCPKNQVTYYKNTPYQLCAERFANIKKPIEGKGYIKVTEQGWSGWTRLQPMPETKILELESNTNLINFYKTSLEIVDIKEDSLTMKSIRVKGSIDGQEIYKSKDLFDCPEIEFSISKGQILKLQTCTMDEGSTWYVQYL
jgi:hypothetical protein